MARVRWGLWVLALGLAVYLSCRKQSGGLRVQRPYYVGDSVCQRCHGEVAKAYARTWKARSLLPVSSSLARIEDFGAAPAYDSVLNFYYWARWEGDSLYIYEARLSGKDTTHLRRERVDFVIGSGHQTRSYLTWRQGYLYEAPLTWYVAAKKWDLSPGYEGGHNSRFSREIQPTCLACHASGWEAVPFTYNGYVKVGGPLGCESCHGPGSAHVKNPQDPAYYFRAWSPAHQMDVCSRCHLEGIAVEKGRVFYPGDTLSACYAIFLPQRADLAGFGIASHVERLRLSRCFQAGGLTCTTCHQPHPTQVVLSYEQRCLSCHRQGCNKPDHPATGCVSCHMPRDTTIDIPHVRFTDHYIRVVRPLPKAPLPLPRLLCATEADPDSALVGWAYLKWYIESGQQQAFSLALSILERHPHPVALPQALFLAGQFGKAERAVTVTDSSLVMFDIRGYLLEMQGRLEEAMRWWEALAQLAPKYPDAAFRAAILGAQLGRLTPEQLYRRLQKVLALQPFVAQFQYNAGLAAYQMGNLTLARQHWQAALRLDPDYRPAREALAQLARKGY